MTNQEKHKEEILDLVISNACIGVDNETGELAACSSRGGCAWCKFYDDPAPCAKLRKKWYNEEYVEPKVDWLKVPVDTPILVCDHLTDYWHKAYFAKYKDGRVFAFENGRTSWSVDQDSSLIEWKYAKLAESEENVE